MGFDDFFSDSSQNGFAEDVQNDFAYRRRRRRRY